MEVEKRKEFRFKAFVKFLQTQDLVNILTNLQYHIIDRHPKKSGPVRQEIDEEAWKRAWDYMKQKGFGSKLGTTKRKRENLVLQYALSPLDWVRRYPSIMNYAEKSNALLNDDVRPPGKWFFAFHYYVEYLNALLRLNSHVKSNNFKRIVWSYNGAMLEFIKDIMNSTSLGTVDGQVEVYLTKKGKISKNKNEWVDTFQCRLSRKLGSERLSGITFPIPPEFFGTLMGEKTKNIVINLSLWWPDVFTSLFRCLSVCDNVEFNGEYVGESRIFQLPKLMESVKNLTLRKVLLPDTTTSRVTFEKVMVQPKLKSLKLFNCLSMSKNPKEIAWVMKFRKESEWGKYIQGLKPQKGDMHGDQITAFVRLVAPKCTKLILQQMYPPVRVKKDVEDEEKEILPLDLISEGGNVYAGLPESVRTLSLENMFSMKKDDQNSKMRFEEEDLKVLFFNMPGLELLETLYLRGKAMNIVDIDRHSLVGLLNLKKIQLQDLEKLKNIKANTFVSSKRLEELVIKNCPKIDIDQTLYYRQFEDARFFLSLHSNANDYDIRIEKSGTVAWNKAVATHKLRRIAKLKEDEKRDEIKKKKPKKRKLVLRNRNSTTSNQYKEDVEMLDSALSDQGICQKILPRPFHLMATTRTLPWWYKHSTLKWTQLKNWALVTYIYSGSRGDFFVEVEDKDDDILAANGQLHTLRVDVFDERNPGNYEQVYRQIMQLQRTDLNKKEMASLIAIFGWKREDRLIPVSVNFEGDISDEYVNVISVFKLLSVNMENSEYSLVNDKMELIRKEGIFRYVEIVAEKSELNPEKERIFQGVDLVVGKFELNPDKKTLEFTATLTQLMRVLGAQVLYCMLSKSDGFFLFDWEDENIELPTHLVSLKRLIYTIMANIEALPTNRQELPFFKAAMDNEFIIMWQMATSLSVFLDYAKESRNFKETVDGRKLSLIKSKFKEMMIRFDEFPAYPGFDGYEIINEETVIPENTITVPLHTDQQGDESAGDESADEEYDYYDEEDEVLSRILQVKLLENESRRDSLNKITNLADLFRSKGVTPQNIDKLGKIFDTKIEVDMDIDTEVEVDIENEQDITMLQIQATTSGAQGVLKKRRAMEQNNHILENLRGILTRVDDLSLPVEDAVSKVVKLLTESLATAKMISNPIADFNFNNSSSDELEIVLHDALRAKQLLVEVIVITTKLFENYTATDELSSSIVHVNVQIEYYTAFAGMISGKYKSDGWKKMDLTDAAICTICEKVTTMQCQECKFVYCSEECMDLDQNFHLNYLNCQAAIVEMEEKCQFVL